MTSVVGLHVAVELDGVAAQLVAVELAGDDVPVHVLGIVGVAADELVGHGGDRDDAGPEIGVGDGDVPGGVAADAVAGEEHAVGVDREAAAGVAERAEHGMMLAGRVVVGELVRLLPVDGDDDVAVPGGLAEAFAAFFVGGAGPEVEHLLGADAGVGAASRSSG